MKKNILYFIVIFILVFFIGNVCAEEIGNVYGGTSSTTIAPVKYQTADGEQFFYVDKDAGCTPIPDSTVEGVEGVSLCYYKISQDKDKIKGDLFKKKGDEFYFITRTDDEAVKESDKWWISLRACSSHSGWKYFFVGDYTRVITTDFTITYYQGKPSNVKCATFSPVGVSEDKLVKSCSFYNNALANIQEYANKYEVEKNASYKTKYIQVLEEVRTACSQGLSTADYNDPCVMRCLDFNRDKAEWDSWFSISVDNTKKCGLSTRLLAWIINIVKWVKYIAPVLVILLGIFDFIRAIASSKDDEIKKAQGRFIRRVIAAALIYLVPTILIFVFEKMGFNFNGCGIM